jgi:hypothetical protein
VLAVWLRLLLDYLGRTGYDCAAVLLVPLSLPGKGMSTPEAIAELRFQRPSPGEAMLAHLQKLFPIPMRSDCDCGL